MRDDADLSREEIARYARHLALPEVTIEGQRRLKRSSVILIGAGGLGSPAALYLAAAGVGRIGLVDYDVVDESNLQRQVLHDSSWVGRPKLESAAARLSRPQPARPRRGPRRRPHPRERPLPPRRLRRGGRRHRQLRDAVPHERRVLLPRQAERVRVDLSGSRARRASSGGTAGPATAASFPSPRRRASFRAAPKAAFSASCPASSGASRPPRPSRSCCRWASRSWAACSCTTLSRCGSTRWSSRAIPPAPCARPSRRSSSCRTTRPSAPARAASAGPVDEIEAVELRRRLDAGEPLEIIDVREPHEWAVCRIEGARLLPLGSLAERVHELDPARTYVLQCRSGVRSAKALGLLRQAGFARLLNLRGGILAWARDVDPTLPVF